MELYQAATKALEQGDLVVLANIAIELEIEPPEIDEEHFKKTNLKIKNIKDEINRIQSTLAWHWYFTEDEKTRSTILCKIKEILNESKNK